MSAYLLAKIRGKLSRMVSEEDAQSLREVDWETLIQRLQAVSYLPPVEEESVARISDRLRQGFLTDVSNLAHSLYGQERTMVLDVLARYRVENLKVILRAQLRHFPADEMKRHLFTLSWEDIDYPRLLDLPGLEAVIKALPWEEYRQRLDAVHRQVGDRQELFPYEAELDALYLQRLIHHCQRGEFSVKQILKNRTLKDVFSWAFRLKGYGRTFPEIVNILPDFSPLIPHDEMRHIVEDGEGWHDIARFLGTTVGKELREMDRFDLVSIEALFDRALVELARAAFVSAPFGMGIVVGYIYLKEHEMITLINALEQVRIRTRN